MNPGPGSTFKPIVFSATSSQFNLGWQSLKIGDFRSYGPLDKGRVRHFAGKTDGFKLRVLSTNYENHDVKHYLRKSTNDFNSMVLYLGAFEEDQLTNIFSNDTYFSRRLSANPTDNFPLI